MKDKVGQGRKDKFDVGVIGGGVMGLTLAYRLSQAGCRVRVIESGSQVGGLSTWFDYGPFVWDKYYHVILKQDTQLLQLIDELNLSERMCWRKTKTGFLWRKKLISMSNYREFAQFPALNIFEKLRLGLGILYTHYCQHPADLQEVPAKKWLVSVFGRGVYSSIWEPLLESKYSILKEEVPASLICGTIKRYFGTRSKSGSAEWMGYLGGGGLKVLLETLSDKIRSKGGEILCGQKVGRICDESAGSVTVTTEQGEYACDKVISTVPSVVLERLMPGFKPLQNRSGRKEYLGVVRLALLLNASLSPYYVTNLIDKNLPFTGIIELSNVVDRAEFGDKHLVMLPRYDIPTSEWFSLPDDEIRRRFLAPLRETWPDLDRHLSTSFVHRERIVQAIWLEGTPGTEPLRSEDGRVWSANTELAGTDNLNNNAIVSAANRVSKEVMGLK